MNDNEYCMTIKIPAACRERRNGRLLGTVAMVVAKGSMRYLSAVLMGEVRRVSCLETIGWTRSACAERHEYMAKCYRALAELESCQESGSLPSFVYTEPTADTTVIGSTDRQ